jgi:hypothetical protein
MLSVSLRGETCPPQFTSIQVLTHAASQGASWRYWTARHVQSKAQAERERERASPHCCGDLRCLRTLSARRRALSTLGTHQKCIPTGLGELLRLVRLMRTLRREIPGQKLSKVTVQPLLHESGVSAGFLWRSARMTILRPIFPGMVQMIQAAPTFRCSNKSSKSETAPRDPFYCRFEGKPCEKC